MLQMTGEEGVRETLETQRAFAPSKGSRFNFFHIGLIVTQASLVAQRVKNLIAMQETWV